MPVVPEFFAAQHRPDDVGEVGVAEVPGRVQAGDHLADHLLLDGADGGLVARVHAGGRDRQVGMIASRTMKLVSRMQGSPRRGGIGSGTSAGRVHIPFAAVVRRVAPVVLDLFLVVLDLLLDLVGRQVERVVHVAVLVGRDELVLVLGDGDDLDVHLAVALAVEVDRDLDQRQPVEVVEQLLGLLLELLLDVVVQVPVAG